MTKPHPEAARVFARAFSEGFKMPEVLARGGVSRSTWWRIRSGKDFKASSIKDIDRAIDEFIAERDNQRNPDGPQAES